MPLVPCADGTLGSLYAIAGMLQSGNKASPWSRSPSFMFDSVDGPSEQFLKALKSSKNKPPDVVAQPQRAISTFCIAGSNQSSLTSACSNYEVQPAELEELLGTLPKDPVDTHSTGFGGLGQSSEDDALPVYASVRSEVFVGIRQAHDAHADSNKHFEPSEYASHRASGLEPIVGMQEAHEFEGIDNFQSHHVAAMASRDAVLVIDHDEHAQQSCNGIQHVGTEDRSFRTENLTDGVRSYDDDGGRKSVISNIDVQMSGSRNHTKGALSPTDTWSAVFKDPNGDEGALLPIACTDAKESMDALHELATLRMPIHRTPTYLTSESVSYLESLGVDSTILFQHEPAVVSCTVQQIKAIISVLEHYGLKVRETGRIFNLCPKILLLDPEKDIPIVASFLFNEAGLSPQDFPKVIRRCPRLLVADVGKQLRPTLSFLRTLGFSRISHTLAKNPMLLSCDVETRLIPRLRLLESWGFTYREATGMAVRFPAIFNYSMENVKAKHAYLVQEIGASKQELLDFPQYFGYSLEMRIRPRHECIVKLGLSVSLQTMLMLKDPEFVSKFMHANSASTEIEVGASLYESIEAKLLERKRRESSLSTSTENLERRVLVNVQGPEQL